MCRQISRREVSVGLSAIRAATKHNDGLASALVQQVLEIRFNAERATTQCL